MEIEYVNKGLEPLLLVTIFLEDLHDRRDLFAAFLLVLGLVGVPDHEEKSFPESPDILEIIWRLLVFVKPHFLADH